MILDWAISIMEALGAVGVGVAVFLENVFPPIPSEVVLPLAGFTTTQGDLNVWVALVWSVIGSVSGGVFALRVGALDRGGTVAADRRLDVACRRDRRGQIPIVVRKVREVFGVFRTVGAGRPKFDFDSGGRRQDESGSLRCAHCGGQHHLERGSDLGWCVVRCGMGDGVDVVRTLFDDHLRGRRAHCGLHVVCFSPSPN